LQNTDFSFSGERGYSGQLDFRVTPTHFAVMHNHRRQNRCLRGRGANNICPNTTDLVGKFHMQIAY